jgi:hypothetical protein
MEVRVGENKGVPHERYRQACLRCREQGIKNVEVLQE